MQAAYIRTRLRTYLHSWRTKRSKGSSTEKRGNLEIASKERDEAAEI
jgi:hypothetical protein